MSKSINFVTIDLAGFSIGSNARETTAISAGNDITGITVRNGSIYGFTIGVELDGTGSIVEGLRVFGTPPFGRLGIAATGIVKGNTVVGIASGDGISAVGISATGVVVDNYALNNRTGGFQIGQGSTVIGNTATSNFAEAAGISVSCPSNVTDNTAVNNRQGNLILNGCNNTNNVAP